MPLVNWLQNQSLRTKATVSVLLIILVALSASVTATILQTNRIIAREQQHSVTMVAHGLAHASELAIAVGDVVDLTRQANGFLDADENVLFVAIFDQNGRLMTKAVRDEAAWHSFQQDTIDDRDIILVQRTVLQSMADGHYELDAVGSITHLQPVGDAQPKPIGEVVVGHSTAAVQASQASQAKMAILLGLMIVALVVPGIYLIIRASLQRLENMAHICDSISRGDYSQSFVDTRDDEIGTLARTFDTMRAAIEQRDAEARQFNETLQQQVHERTAALEEALIAAEAANASKTQFLANMSHEIRTPMTAILGYAELMIDPHQGPSDRLDCVQTISRNASHLLSIINDILDISKIEAGKMAVEQIDCSPAQIVADVASLMRGKAVEKNLDYVVDYHGPIPQTIKTDPTRLRQILINLSSNAIKFTQRGEVRLVAQLVDQNDTGKATMRFDVIDTGVGMTEQQISNLFQPFTQADNSTTRKFGGTGLGLSISKRLANMLGGDITVKSTHGQGTRFSLEIDAGCISNVKLIEIAMEAEANVVDPAPSPSPSPQLDSMLAGMQILLAEDGPDNQRLIMFHLRRAGAVVDLAENGRIACDMALAAKAAGEPYDVVLMDMQMPEVDGYSAASKLRSRGYERPIIALTAHAMAGDRDRCVSAGCNDYTTKPIDRNTLITMVAHWAKLARRKAA